MSRARDIADLAGSADAGGLTGRNLIINGAMQVAQRGTSQTGVTVGGYLTAPDRYIFQPNNAGTWSVSQSTTTPDGFANSYRVECTTADASLAAGDYVLFEQRFEGQNLQHLKKGTSSAESITVSFWVRSAKTGTYIVEIDDNDNTRNINKAYTISSANTWEHKTITFEGDTTGTLDNDNAFSLRVLFWLAAGSDFSSGTLATSWESTTNANRAVGNVNLADTIGNDWHISGVQLEVGETATPFEHEDYGTTLAKCQRYYEKNSTNSLTFLTIPTTNDGSRFLSYQFKERKRIAPTMSATLGGTFTTVAATSSDVDNFALYSSPGNNNNYSVLTSFTADAEL